jgi:hypothetical protein
MTLVKRLLLVVALLGPMLCAVPAIAAASSAVASTEAPLPPDALIPEWAFILGKATTFELASSAMEAGLFVAFFGGGGGAAGTVFAVTLVSAFGIYVLHEMAWEAVLPPTADRADPTIVAERAITYRVLSLARSFIAGSYLGNAHAGASAAFAVAVSIADTGLFVAHDLTFARLRRWLAE